MNLCEKLKEMTALAKIENLDKVNLIISEITVGALAAAALGDNEYVFYIPGTNDVQINNITKYFTSNGVKVSIYNTMEVGNKKIILGWK